MMPPMTHTLRLTGSSTAECHRRAYPLEDSFCSWWRQLVHSAEGSLCHLFIGGSLRLDERTNKI